MFSPTLLEYKEQILSYPPVGYQGGFPIHVINAQVATPTDMQWLLLTVFNGERAIEVNHSREAKAPEIITAISSANPLTTAGALPTPTNEINATPGEPLFHVAQSPRVPAVS
ncbi:MAG: hypothetical protein P4M15_01730 [Alphaproteobacteria bacterium]|nr:hypothetical protein [Alphaproteobacteria bacterium]